ncbi:MAG: hypothetical protein ABIY55_04830, partial [Kofleriaceae bacterium]
MSRAALLASERWRRAFKLPGQPPSTPWARAPVADEPNPSAAKIAARGTSGLALGSDNKAISQRKYVEQIDKGVDAKAAERLAHKNAHDGHSAAHSDGSIYNSHHRLEGQLEGQVSTT